jgi:hypothetical protein
MLIGGQVHLVRVDRPVNRHRSGDGDKASSAPPSIFSTPGITQPGPPTSRTHHAAAWRSTGLGHEAQVVDLLAHLRDQRDADRHRRAEGQRVEPRQAVGSPG